ncbi:MAG: serine hydrolase [Kordiimonadaceae bacterium]|nr:serine hydrolase [Kordiimonadaceae bacterium]
MTTIYRILFGIFFAAIPVLSNATNAQEAEVHKLLEQYDRADSPGFSIGIAKDGKQVFAKGYGMADLEQDIPNRTDTIFHVASVSKQFTAFAIALLAREGKVDLDADIRDYLPYVPDFGHTITVRHLILHTSGLRDQWELFFIGGMWDAVKSQKQIVNMVSRQTALNFKPGEEYLYCNTGYSLLGEIVKAVSGQNLRDYTTEHMFKPLGMNNTFFYDDITEVVPNRAHSYERDEKGSPWKRSLLNINNVGATSLHTTVEDLLKWTNNFRAPTVGDKALIKQITTMGQLNNGNPINYGFALYKQDYNGHTAMGHGGADSGFRASFNYFMEDDLAIVLTTNAPDILDRSKIIAEIAELYLGQKELAAVPEKTDPQASLLDELSGAYQDRVFDEVAEIKRTETGVTFFGAPLVFRKDGTFDMGDAQRRSNNFYKIVRNTKGKITGIKEGEAGSDGRTSHHSKVTIATPTDDDLIELEGDYRSSELDVTYSLSVKDGELSALMIWFDDPIIYKPASKDTFLSEWTVLKIVRDKMNKVSGIRISGGRARNLELKKVS